MPCTRVLATLVVANLYRINERDERVVVEDWENDGKLTELVFKSGAGTPLVDVSETFLTQDALRILKVDECIVGDCYQASSARTAASRGVPTPSTERPLSP